MSTAQTLVLRPRVSEKAYGLSLTRNTYVFDVPKDANKLTVRQAVEAQFGVTVTDVNIAVAKGKAKRSFQKRKQPIAGKRTDIKRAYVVLKAGDQIPLFASADEKEAK